MWLKKPECSIFMLFHEKKLCKIFFEKTVNKAIEKGYSKIFLKIFDWMLIVQICSRLFIKARYVSL